LDLPPPRGDYLRYAIIFDLIKEARGQATKTSSQNRIDFDSICNSLGIKSTEEKRKKRVQKFIDRSVEENLIIKDSHDRYRVADQYNSTWLRIKKLVTTIGDQIFDGAGDGGGNDVCGFGTEDGFCCCCDGRILYHSAECLLAAFHNIDKIYFW